VGEMKDWERGLEIILVDAYVYKKLAVEFFNSYA
jgi:hypothetical protein